LIAFCYDSVTAWWLGRNIRGETTGTLFEPFAGIGSLESEGRASLWRKEQSMWSNFYENGGWGMYPTTLFGFFLVASAVVLLLRPERRYLRLVGSFAVLTMASGVLGCCIGMIKTFRYIWEVVPEEQLQIAALGCAESLNNVVLALLIILVSGLLVTISAFRAARTPTSIG
jgi:hypothetical protein